MNSASPCNCCLDSGGYPLAVRAADSKPSKYHPLFGLAADKRPVYIRFMVPSAEEAKKFTKFFLTNRENEIDTGPNRPFLPRFSIPHHTAGGISIGVSGASGVEKSSMIRLIRRSLDRRENADFIFVEF
jgi:hypothetical protein